MYRTIPTTTYFGSFPSRAKSSKIKKTPRQFIKTSTNYTYVQRPPSHHANRHNQDIRTSGHAGGDVPAANAVTRHTVWGRALTRFQPRHYLPLHLERTEPCGLGRDAVCVWRR